MGSIRIANNFRSSSVLVGVFAHFQVSLHYRPRTCPPRAGRASSHTTTPSAARKSSSVIDINAHHKPRRLIDRLRSAHNTVRRARRDDTRDVVAQPGTPDALVIGGPSQGCDGAPVVRGDDGKARGATAALLRVALGVQVVVESLCVGD